MHLHVGGQQGQRAATDDKTGRLAVCEGVLGHKHANAALGGVPSDNPARLGAASCCDEAQQTSCSIQRDGPVLAVSPTEMLQKERRPCVRVDWIGLKGEAFPTPGPWGGSEANQTSCCFVTQERGPFDDDQAMTGGQPAFAARWYQGRAAITRWLDPDCFARRDAHRPH